MLYAFVNGIQRRLDDLDKGEARAALKNGSKIEHLGENKRKSEEKRDIARQADLAAIFWSKGNKTPSISCFAIYGCAKS